jgi:glycosyltransferase involved in cell wall biosynthesis
MLSICIPTYNFSVYELIQSLSQQAIKEHVGIEIIVIDDCSSDEFKKFNQKINNLLLVKYIELPENIGRSKIRNLFLQHASFDHLLFIDCDAKVLREDFIHHYIENIGKAEIVVGGVAYDKEKSKKSLRFRWKYGHKRECTSLGNRLINPYDSFKTFNFLASRNLIKSIGFDQSISKYGHEDTLFGIALKKSNVSILHIDNPLIHIGLEPNNIFLDKTKKAIDGLWELYSSHKFDEHSNIRLLNTYLKLNNVIRRCIAFSFLVFSALLKITILAGTPSLVLFDLYKLSYLCKVAK